MEFLKLWQIVLRRKWIFIGVFLAFFLALAIGMLLLPKTYEANTKILVNLSYPLSNLTSSIDLKSKGAESDDYEYETEIALVIIKPILEELIAKLDLKDSDGETIEAEDIVKTNPLKKLAPQPYVEVEQYEDSDILQITAKSGDAKEAASIANQLAELYILAETKRAQNEYRAAKAFVQGEFEKAKKDYYQTLDDIKNYNVKEGIADLSKETENLIDKVAALTEGYENNEKTILELEKNIFLNQQQLDGISEFRKESKDYVYNEQIKNFKSKISELLISLASKSVDIRKDHPDYVQIEKQLSETRELLKKEADFTLDGERFAVDPTYESLSKQLVDGYIDKELAKARREILKKYLDSYYHKIMRMPTLKAKSLRLDTDLTIKKEIYQDLFKYLLQVGITEALNLSNIRVVESARVPEKPDFPKKPLILAVAVFFGFFWSVVCGLLVEYTDVNVKSADELKSISSAVLMAQIPFSAYLENRRTLMSVEPLSKMQTTFNALCNSLRQIPYWTHFKNRRTALSVEPIYEVQTAYRALCNSLRLNSEGHPLQTLMVTSSHREEGKSSVAANLAIMFGKEGCHTLLVDLNDHNPELERFFESKNTSGVADILTDGRSTEEVISQTGISNLSLLGAGDLPSDWMTPQNIEELGKRFEEIKGQYQRVVIDTVPVLPTKDIINLAHLADGALFVVAPGKASAEIIEENIRIFEKLGVPWVGLVANRFI